MTTQRHEIEAWLGHDFRDQLTDEQIDEFVRIADDIGERYPDQDDSDEREAALIAAYRVITGDLDVIEEQARRLLSARIAEAEAMAALKQAAISAIDSGQETQAGFARRAGVDRMTIRSWLGKR
jgi:hypothetical protein